MGWQTFHRTAKQDKSLPAWIPSTIHYARWGWGELEPQPGKLNTDFLDKALKESRESGQQLAFRVMCCSTYKGHPYHPKWIKEIGGKELQADYEGQGPFGFSSATSCIGLMASRIAKFKDSIFLPCIDPEQSTSQMNCNGRLANSPPGRLPMSTNSFRRSIS
jgi:hypothetical protein